MCKETVAFKPIHIAVISVLSVLLLACIIGSIFDYQSTNISNEKLSTCRKFFICFSAITNFQRLMCSSKGSEELKALHGLRALSMGWIMLGHTYVWINYQLLRSPNTSVVWFNRFDFEVILNGWLAVEPFLSPQWPLNKLYCIKDYGKTKGRINVAVYILRRYIRRKKKQRKSPFIKSAKPIECVKAVQTPWCKWLTDACLTAADWSCFLHASHKFWSLLVREGGSRACILYQTLVEEHHLYHAYILLGICQRISNCMSSLSYFLYVLYKYPKLGISMICSAILACSVVVGLLTIRWDLPPTIQVSSGNSEKIQDTVDIVHMKTFTHAGPYFCGYYPRFLMIKYKDIRMPWFVNSCGWFASTLLCLTSVYGAHRWNIGDPHGPLLTAIFAAVHRTTFAMGVGWITFSCVTGHGGVVNKCLSWSLLTPVSRLTFMIYLLHSLVIWVRMGSLRERLYFSHYNMLYEYVGNIVTTLILSVPFYLLLEAPPVQPGKTRLFKGTNAER
ncbi:nose resistant to fluoxetine protein 6 [Caerostris extrusa]|uniref:Nose resistant to fluoxetine protein 6 n=1 Tax=Caerostris extrusa TaxID=172846 RepID=A0AAV4X5F6_CAEEX|nr:nose resistant to fluoxetine protein 6 [Caerostris extrusa]